MRDERLPVTPDEITAAARESFDGAPDRRLRLLLQRLVDHLHAYVREVELRGAGSRRWSPAPCAGPTGGSWRPAHLHVMVSAPGYRTVATYLFDRTSPHLGDDAVFGVKPSLVVDFVAHGPDEPGAPEGWNGTWYSVERDLVLVPAGD